MKYTEDPIVNIVVKSFIDRSNTGMIKYGMTMKDNPLELVPWLRHLQEELMDATLYIERSIDELSKVEPVMHTTKDNYNTTKEV